MQKRQPGPRSHHRWHLRASFNSSAMIGSLLAACGTPNASSRPTPTSTVTPSHSTIGKFDRICYCRKQHFACVEGRHESITLAGQTGQLTGGTPIVENGIIYAGSSHTVYAFTASDGTLLWSTDVDHRVEQGQTGFPEDILEESGKSGSSPILAPRDGSWRKHGGASPSLGFEDGIQHGLFDPVHLPLARAGKTYSVQ